MVCRKFQPCNHLSEKTVLMIADQLIERLETLHRHDYIHRDVKVRF